jgi:lipoyl(octanoyl) transferase
MSLTETVNIHWLGRQGYLPCWQSMKDYTNQRTDQTIDEIWLLEHDPVFTQGQNGKAEHVLNPGNIPIIQTDRGGQITYHGPGQLMVYTLIDLQRKNLNVRQLVTLLEQSITDFLASYNVDAYAKPDAPGVYVDEKKVCSIGLRIRRGRSYHGIAFNVAMDLSPFSRINPCGFSNLKMTQLADLNGPNEVQQTGLLLVQYLMKHLGYTTPHFRESK